MKNQRRIEHLINITFPYCESWIKAGPEGLPLFVDPLDDKEISAHYGATHAAVSFIILGKHNCNRALYKKGQSLFNSIIDRWELNKELPDFHFDFNNFALCVAYDHLTEDELLKDRIRTLVLSTCDSNHLTINWLPMRWLVNWKRYEWTGDERYKQNCDTCKRNIIRATNEDGGIEDRLPNGTSFNLQYNAVTVGLLQYLRCHCESYDLSRELAFLINSVAPDNDINYQGRGTNQIFAWSLWIYLLSSAGKEEVLNDALCFLEERVPIMLRNNNLMLNQWKGAEKYLWWDYHYCSVYTAHFLFWLTLALLDYKKKIINDSLNTECDTGINVYKSPNCFVSIFSGRREYLAEHGPVICALWIKKYGMIAKGTFGPWKGFFGNKHTYGDVVLRNYCGLIEVKENKDWSHSRFIHRFLSKLKSKDSYQITPRYSEIKINEDEVSINLRFENTKAYSSIFNMPILRGLENSLIPELTVDGKKMRLTIVCQIRNQYDWCCIYQSNKSTGKEWVLKITK